MDLDLNNLKNKREGKKKGEKLWIMYWRGDSPFQRTRMVEPSYRGQVPKTQSGEELTNSWSNSKVTSVTSVTLGYIPCYSLLHLSVCGTCEFNRIVCPVIRLHSISLYHSRQGRDSPAGFEDICHHVVRGPHS